eukprot:evm.model.scf_1414.3 EVM.evm.TU.scf_1414.3   scf_1414:19293-20354(+)
MGIKRHPNWTGTVDDGNDLALIKLDGRSTIQPVKILNDIWIPPTTLLAAVGWGAQETKCSQSSRLQHATRMQLLAQEDCRRVWAPEVVIQDSMMCTVGDQSVCNGDSGGPLLLPYAPGGNVSAGMATEDLLAGIVSFGNGSNCRIHASGVYTRVPSFREWIDAMMGK